MKAVIHWNKKKKMWTVHTYKGCTWAGYIRVNGKWRTESKPEKKSNPRGWVVVDDHNQVEILEAIEEAEKVLFATRKLLFNKEKVEFNVGEGTGLIFTPEGAYIPLKGGESG